MDMYITLRFHHGGKLKQKPRIKYGGDDVGGEFNATFEGSGGLGFEEAAQPQEPIVGEVLGRTSASVGEDLGRASASVGKDLSRASISVGEDLGATSSAVIASDIPEIGSD
ncbi:hypothetical protein KY289_033741 [Solanum tuberosum]|nr:hypothetical protein KY289_033741 [Solanum tuberosum]